MDEHREVDGAVPEREETRPAVAGVEYDEEDQKRRGEANDD